MIKEAARGDEKEKQTTGLSQSAPNPPADQWRGFDCPSNHRRVIGAADCSGALCLAARAGKSRGVWGIGRGDRDIPRTARRSACGMAAGAAFLFRAAPPAARY